MAKYKRSGKEPLWGYIEGYYWRLMSWEERTRVSEHIGRIGGNSYLYAPKEDPLHRREWRTSYGKKWLDQWKSFSKASSKAGVDAIPGLAPGLSFDYLDPKDYKALLKKFEVFRDAGSTVLALLMDDISPLLPEKSEGHFRSLGEAHAVLLLKLLNDLNQGTRKCRLWFCPTVYTDQFATVKVSKGGVKSKVVEDPYLVDLAAGIPKEIMVLWTGPSIISESLSAGSIQPIAKLFRGNLVIWDNLYANDYCPNKLFVGPYRGRQEALWNWTRGVMLNPTGLPLTDMFLLTLLAAFRNGISSKSAWEEALRAFAVPEGFKKIARFLDNPFYLASQQDLSRKSIEVDRKALYPLIWSWVSPLHREWAPFLFMLDADLKASLRGRSAPDSDWIRKRYSPLVAKVLAAR